jgi:small subunit ribosomal protein S1
VLAGRAAAHLLGFDGFGPGPIEAAVQRTRRVHRPFGVVHEVRQLALIDRTTVGRYPVTSGARTIIDLAACCSAIELAASIGSALRDGWTSETFLHRRLTDLGGRGRRGVRLLRQVADEPFAHSSLERAFLRLVRSAGLALPRTQVTFRGQRTMRVDAFWDDARRRRGVGPSVAPHPSGPATGRATPQRAPGARLRRPRIHGRRPPPQARPCHRQHRSPPGFAPAHPSFWRRFRLLGRHNLRQKRLRRRRCYPFALRGAALARRVVVDLLPKADLPLSDTEIPAADAPMGAFQEDGTYTPRQVVADDLGMSFADAIDGTLVEVEDGQIVQGTVVKVDKDEVLLDIGYKSEGIIPARELSIRNDVDPGEVVSLGDEIEALVLTKEDKEGRLVLSKKRAQYERAWGTIEKIKETEGVVEGPVIEVVKGGLILDIGLRGFLPASLVELRRVRDLQPYVGRVLQAKIIELDKNRNNVVLSRRAYLEETQKEQREDFLHNLKPGEVRKGVVSSVVSFGAFVDLGGMDGLIHVSELSWKHVDHPSSVVQVGDDVTVQVLDVDLDRERISLSLKATQQDPWQEFASTHRVGELVYGRVTKLVPFGAFVQVGEGIEGLVHISEMSAHHVDLPEQVVTPAEELWVKIIDLDLARRRISLSIKQAAEGGEVAEEYREHFGEHAFDDQGNYIGVSGEDDAERQAAWAEYYEGLGGEGGQRES